MLTVPELLLGLPHVGPPVDQIGGASQRADLGPQSPEAWDLPVAREVSKTPP
jgi:hypothetical protein